MIGIGRFGPLAVAASLLLSACSGGLWRSTAAPSTGPGRSVTTRPAASSERAPAPISVPAPVAVPAASSASLPTLEQLAAARADDAGLRSYRLGPGDVVEITVFDLKELNRKARVSESGEISLPLVGAIRAEGKTEAELGEEIASRLEKDYLQDPHVDVFVAEYHSELVAVTGSVMKPGLYPLTRDRNSILDMLSEAGGPSREAGPIVEFMPARSLGATEAMNRVRGGDIQAPPAEVRGISIALEEVTSGTNRTLLELQVLPGDVIYVPETGMIAVEGWVDKPGNYVLTRGMTVLSALAAGGGELFPAELSRVELFREESMSGSGRAKQIVDLAAVRDGRARDVMLRPGDVIRVPANPLRLAPYSVYWVIKNFILFGIGASVPIQA